MTKMLLLHVMLPVRRVVVARARPSTAADRAKRVQR